MKLKIFVFVLAFILSLNGIALASEDGSGSSDSSSAESSSDSINDSRSDSSSSGSNDSSRSESSSSSSNDDSRSASAGYVDDSLDLSTDDSSDLARSSGMEIETENGITYLKPHDTAVGRDAELEDTVKGRILLQVEEHGEAWYVDPATSRAAFLGRPADAFKVMRNFGMGITNKNLDLIPEEGSDQEGGALAKRLAGRILLQVEENGEAWYVDPVSLQRIYLGRPIDAFNIMHDKGMGISNENLDKLSGIKMP